MIKPENRNKYPKNWKQISYNLILERGGKCERCNKVADYYEKGEWLTVHHKDRNPANNKKQNLIVLCPKCHFKVEYLINKGYYNNPNQLELL